MKLSKLCRQAVLVMALIPGLGHAAGALLLVGGGLKDDNTALYQRFIQLAGGSGQARIGVITAASIPESQDPDAGTANAANSRANGLYYAKLLKTDGAADAQWIPIDLDNIANSSNPTVVNQINGISFDVSKPTEALDEARRLAAADATRKAKLYAETMGVTLGPVLSISEGVSYQPPVPMLRTTAAPMADAARPVPQTPWPAPAPARCLQTVFPGT